MSNPTYSDAVGSGLVYDRIAPATGSIVGSVRRGLDSTLHRLDVPKDLRSDVALVVSEAATNVVMHAYLGLPRGPLYAAARVTPDALVVAVGDAGRGVAPRADSPGLGYGLPLISRLSDDLVLAPPPEGGGTIVIATFRRAMPSPPELLDGEQHDSVDEYVSALLAGSPEAADDDGALAAEADDALRRGEEIRRAFLRAG